MTEAARTARVYVIAVALLLFVVLWSMVSQQPYPASSPAHSVAQAGVPDPRVAQLQRRQRALARRERAVRLDLARRRARYQRRRAVRLKRIASINRSNRAAQAAARAASAAAASYSPSASARSVYVPAVRVAPSPAPAVTATSSS